ncbi:phosphoesterase [Mycolicibacterium madagascariense]|uniref:Phosphoesterase n=1 Tax=Mycolicibacterium madagascariense TaxID=212765 RepID=A0A7I7XAQ3_9MYCO|nr:PA-phosphatase [Mycolicibacterium madagascariense]MCV7014811.1 PA-phosphatase [Mycolicibacterium madagascariense]BBZ26522.1 phosphoesterase [Mycolicibacterium madagascariense]
MSRHAVLRWWPLVGIAAMVVLGLVVGKGSTPLDDWFLHYRVDHPWVWFLLHFTDRRLVVAGYLVAIAVVCVQRRWRLAAVTALTPVVAVTAERVLKRLFGREKVGALAYPSGHVTVSLVVLALLVIAAGAATWMFVVATVVLLAGLVGQACTYHYFTDTVGAVLLGTSLMCLAALAAGLDRCQPRCDPDHSGG